MIGALLRLLGIAISSGGAGSEVLELVLVLLIVYYWKG